LWALFNNNNNNNNKSRFHLNRSLIAIRPTRVHQCVIACKKNGSLSPLKKKYQHAQQVVISREGTSSALWRCLEFSLSSNSIHTQHSRNRKKKRRDEWGVISKLCSLISFFSWKERESALLAAARYTIPTSGPETAQEGRRMIFFCCYAYSTQGLLGCGKPKRSEILLLLSVFDSENSNYSN
jgi:hypothetical protein